MKGHKGVIFAVDLSEDARVAFTASGDKVCRASFPKGKLGFFEYPCVIHIIYAGLFQTIRVWEVSKGRCVQELQAGPSLPVIALHYTKVYICPNNSPKFSCADTIGPFAFREYWLLLLAAPFLCGQPSREKEWLNYEATKTGTYLHIVGVPLRSCILVHACMYMDVHISFIFVLLESK